VVLGIAAADDEPTLELIRAMWRQLQRFTGHRELLPDTINTITGIVPDRCAGLTW
jgi:hypothetical protein